MRVDVERDLKDVRGALSPRRIPLGRWPSASANVPSLGQLLALNEMLADPKRGVWAVNGPPGTGKTVMLRDLMAGLVVERAKKMAELDPSEAFGEPLPWRGRSVHPPVAELCGYEVVLACATNAAAENVSAEIPAVEAIDAQWWGMCDYFPEIVTRMLTPPDCEQPRDAWAMVAVVLGSRARNKAFVSRFWWEGMRDVLERVESGSESAGTASTWEQAVARVRTLGGAMRIWRLQRARLKTAFGYAEHAAGETRAGLAPVETHAAELAASVERHESARSAAGARVAGDRGWSCPARMSAGRRTSLRLCRRMSAGPSLQSASGASVAPRGSTATTTPRGSSCFLRRLLCIARSLKRLRPRCARACAVPPS